jgi:hypothetical protein
MTLRQGAVCPERNAVLLQFLNHIKARTVPFVVRFQYRPQNFAHTSCKLEDTPSAIFRKKSRGIAAKAYRVFCSISTVFLVLSNRLPL